MQFKEPDKFVSIVMPAFNEQVYIGAALKAVSELNYPKDLIEIIVVDNGSTDSTVEIAKKYTDKVHVVPNVRVGAVRNYGVNMSRGEIIAFLDSDCVPPRDWILSTLDYMEKNGCDAVGGLGLVRDNPSWIESSWILNQIAADKPSHILAGASIIMKKSAFTSVGGFNEKINAGEDTALATELIANGFIVHFAKSCAVIHLGYPTDLKTFMARQYWQASSYLKSRKKHGIDLVFYIVLLFLVSFVSAPIAYSFSLMAGHALMALLFILPAILSAKRILTSGFHSNRFVSYLKIYVLDICYLIGRSAGLVKSILTELNIIVDKKSHY